MRILTLILSLLLINTSLWASGGMQSATTFNTTTVTTKLLEYNSADAELYSSVFGISPKVEKFSIMGKEYSYASLGIDGHAKVFEQTGGPVLRRLGLDFRFLDIHHGMSGAIAVFTAFLTLMVGFHWFSVLGNVSKGKGGLEIIPLLGKLCMGMVVVYNMPFVYGAAMTLKDLGEEIVLVALADKKADAKDPVHADASKLLLMADPAAVGAERLRENGVKKGVIKAVSSYLQPISVAMDGTGKIITDPALQAQNSGRLRLAAFVAGLNSEIQHFAASGVAGSANVISLRSGNTTGQPVGRGTIDAVGFNASDPNKIEVPGSGLGATYDRGASITQDHVLANAANNISSATWLSQEYVKTLYKFSLILASTYDSDTAAKSIPDVDTRLDVYYGYTPTFKGINNQALTTTLSKALAPIDKAYHDSAKTDQDGAAYESAISDATSIYWRAVLSAQGIDPKTGQSNGINNMPEATDGGGLFGFLSEILDAVLKLPNLISDVCVSLTKMFWIPVISTIAYYLFQFIIECYVYLLMLAYPFWFYAKTQKAFNGALNTLISAAFTAMTFSVLTLMFEGLVGICMNSVFANVAGVAGGAAAGIIGGLGAAVGATTAPVAAGALLGAAAAIGIGFSIFYIVGTAICLKLAPTIFKSFLEGSSVVTPMIMGALSAGVAGVGAGMLAGAGVGSMAAKGAAAIGRSETGQLIGKSINNSAIGQRVNKGLSAMAQKAKNAGGAIGSGLDKMGTVGRDIKSMGAAVGNAAANIAKNPQGALMSLAGSTAGKTVMLAAAAMSGDPASTIKTVAGVAVAQTTLERLGQRQENIGAQSAYANSNAGNAKQAQAASSYTPGTGGLGMKS